MVLFDEPRKIFPAMSAAVSCQESGAGEVDWAADREGEDGLDEDWLGADWEAEDCEAEDWRGGDEDRDFWSSPSLMLTQLAKNKSITSVKQIDGKVFILSP